MIASRSSMASLSLTLCGMGHAEAELAGYFARKSMVPDEKLIELTSAARTAGSTWPAIAAACGVQAYVDLAGVTGQPSGVFPSTGAGLLFRATQYALQKVTGGRRYPPLTWNCLDCGQRVTDRTATGRPAHTEHGHGDHCARLARDQAADAARRREQLPLLATHTGIAAGLAHYRFSEPIIDDCPRCGWHGYFAGCALADGDWSTALCDNCAADLDPGVTVTVTFFSARGTRQDPHAVIRQRTRSDHPHPDTGQLMTWRLYWQHTPMLVDDQRGSGQDTLAEIGPADAEHIMARLAAEYWPPDAARLPWVCRAYPE